MSKIGKKLIEIPKGVEVKLEGQSVIAKGEKGELSVEIHPKVNVEVKEEGIVVSVKDPSIKLQKALWGTFRSLINNLVLGVSEGYEKKLEIVGVGYKAVVADNKLVLNVGYSHSVELKIPEELEVKVDKNTITVRGIDKQLVGEFAAKTRAVRKPEPYKGKGIKYDD